MMRAITRIRSCLLVTRRTASRPTGTIVAAPIPWKTRSTVNSVRLVLVAHSAEDTVKMTIAMRNTRRAPKRSASHPLSGMSTARVRRYAVIAMLTDAESTPNDRPILGAAVAMIVPSRISMKKTPATRSVSAVWPRRSLIRTGERFKAGDLFAFGFVTTAASRFP